jgi:hypothetical protein
MADEQLLPGGIAHAGAVVRVGDEVRRPASAHSGTIHALLLHLRQQGFEGAPLPLGFAGGGRERLAFIPGDVPIPPYPAWSLTETALASAAELLRRFHDATAGFVSPPGASWNRELADPSPRAEIVCHNDVCPENIVYRDGAAVALLDFDFAAPGRRVFDVAAFARMVVPLEAPEDAARSGRGGLDPVARLRVVADAYGLAAADRPELLEAVGGQIAAGGEFVRRRVEAGEAAFIEMWNATGGAQRYERRRTWFAEQRQRFVDALG